MRDSNLVKISIIISLVLSVVMIANTALSTYVLYTTSFTASMAPENGEQLDIAISTDTGRPTLLERIFDTATDWLNSYSYFVSGNEATQATTGITISVTGSNVAAQASVDYYIEAVASDESGNAYRFLAGNGTAITVGGAALAPTNQTTIENHLTAMGLTTDASHEIDYYLYVRAEATGAISGETLISEIVYTKFDTVNYEYGEPTTDTFQVSADADDGLTITGGANYFYGNDHTYLSVGDSVSLYDRDTAARFTVNIAQGQPIISAKLKFCAFGEVYGSPTGLIAAEDSDNAAQILDMDDFDSRAQTSESVNWSPSGWVAGTWYDSPAITDVVQTVLDRGSWASGNNMIIFVNHVTDGYAGESIYQARSHDFGDGSDAPKLEVSYVVYSSSWYNIPPLSVVDLPMSLDVAAVLAVVISAAIVLKTRRNKQK